MNAAMIDPRILGPSLLAAAVLGAPLVGCDGPRARAESESGDRTSSRAPTEPASEEPAESSAEGATGGADDSADIGDKRGESAPDDSRRPPAERAMDPSVPLPERAREVFEGIAFDPIPEDLTQDAHYVVSNENGHHMYRPHIRGHGEILMGVGTDQNYLLAGWAESPILLMMDFDEQVRNVHHLYDVVFERTEGPQQLVDQWRDDNVEEIRNWIGEDYSGDEERVEELNETLDLAHDDIHYRLRKTAERYREADLPTFLTDEEQFEFVKGLFERGRVVPIRGDLTGETAMLEIADALEELNLELGLLYLSNAEQYFEYDPAYRRNIAVLPFSHDALVLRTRPMEALGVPEGDNYHYNIQGGRNFAGWMAHNDVEDAKQLITWYMTDHRDPEGLSFIRKEPPVSRREPEVAAIADDYDVDIIDKPEDGASEEDASGDER